MRSIANIAIVIAFCSLLSGCGQDASSEFNRPNQQKSLDQVPEFTGELNEYGELILPNSIQNTWDGSQLLGNSVYEVLALD